MSDYLVACWPGSIGPSHPRRKALHRAVETRPDWAWAFLDPSISLAVRGPLETRRVDGGVVVGELFHQIPMGAPMAMPKREDGEDPECFCRRLVTGGWGRYVVVLEGGPGEAAAVFRDPSGGLDAMTWTAEGATFTASDLPEWLDPFLPRDIALDWERIAAWTAGSTAFGGALALSGVEAVAPGVLRSSGPFGIRRRALWTPGHLARLGQRNFIPSPDRLVATIDACVAAYANRPGSIVAELSGGLDSAIVASALVRARSARVERWLNFHVSDPQGDERAYARAVAAHLGLHLTEVSHHEARIEADLLDAISAGARPGLNGLDARHDRDVAAHCRETGATTILTGQGGDMVFFQIATPLIVADHLRRKGLAGLTSPVLGDVARWTRRSAWSVLRTALAALLGAGPATTMIPPAFLTAAARDAAARAEPHPWLADLQGVPPAKRRQIAGLVHGLLFSGASERGRQADLVHPLLAQPVVEYCLASPADVMTAGGRDRAFVRRAFAGRLPAEIIGRRSKGNLSAYYSRMVAASLPLLRSRLLDGRLVSQGLVDRHGLDAALDVDQLMWHGRCGEIMDLVTLEAWIQAWEVRLERLGDRGAVR